MSGALEFCEGQADDYPFDQVGRRRFAVCGGAGGGDDPAGAAGIGNAYNSQFQLPELFYIVVVLAYLLRKADYLFVLLSFGFVAARIVHAYVMVTSNQARLRYGAFAVGMMILALMWASFAVRVLFGV